MIVRIVQMTFREDAVEDFKSLFDAHKELIRAVEGCTHLELLQQEDAPNVFMTYSHWNGPEYLEAYRHSELFKTVWSQTKVLFADKPRAWSMGRLHLLE